MPASWPTSVKTFTTKVDVTDTNYAAHMNDLQLEVSALETYLGTNPHISTVLGQTFASVDARFEYVEANYSTTGHTHGHTDIGTGDPHSQYVLESVLGGKGSIITASAAGTPAPLAVGGTDGMVLEVLAGATYGIQWGTKPIKASVGTTQGDVMYFDGTNWVRLAKGTAHQILHMNTGATAPMWDNGGLAIINTQTDSYTLVGSDGGKTVEMNKATAVNLTVPPNSSVAFPVGTTVSIVQYGAGQVTVVAGVGVTVRTAETLRLRTRYSGGTLYKRATDEWILFGDLEGI